jgi:dolichol-phosphate mannosyltransferase
MLLSIVIPMLDEEEVLPELERRLTSVLAGLDLDAEVICVDDGSTDGTAQTVRELSARDPRFRLVRFSRNFGHQAAITAGIDLAAGDAVVIMDADLQDPPEVLPEMIEQWSAGHEIVYGVREERSSDTAFKRWTASAFYRILDRISEVSAPRHAADFRLLDRAVVDALGALRERDRYLRGMLAWLGYRTTSVHYVRPDRSAGETKYSLSKMMRLAVDGMIGFSNVPLQFATTLGFIFSGLSFLVGLLAALQKILGVDALVRGWTSMLVAIAFIGGIQLIVLGVLGTYLGRTYGEAKMRPLYVVAELHNLSPEDPPIRAVLPREPVSARIPLPR